MKPLTLDYADGLRTAAILAVVALHSSGIWVMNAPVIESLEWWTGHAVDSLSRWAVPAFIMLSGALLLDPERREGILLFYRKRFVRVVIPLLVFAPIYFYWAARYHGEVRTLAEMWLSFRQGLLQNPLYFLFIIIGLYLIVPLLRVVVRKTPVQILWLVCLGLFWIPVSGWLFAHIQLDSMTRFLPYIPYFLLGYLLRVERGGLWAIATSAAAFLASGAWVIVKTYSLVQLYGREDGRSFALYDHFSVPVVIMSAAAFVLCRELLGRRLSPALVRSFALIGPATFGIYLVHALVLDVVYGYAKPFVPVSPPLVLVCEVSAIFIISGLLSLGWLKVPFLRLAIGGK